VFAQASYLKIKCCKFPRLARSSDMALKTEWCIASPPFCQPSKFLAEARPVRRAHLLQSIFLLALLLALPARFLAQAPTDHALTNADIARMIKAGIPESIIVREIQMSRTDLGTSPAALIELRKEGALESILGAVLDSRSGASSSLATALPSANARSAAPGPHHLPNFQADLKIKSNSLAKISMKQNHIKVEKSGVPLFDLKWKEK
jgi:hypothetical protein